MDLKSLYNEFEDLNPNEIKTIHKLVQALKRTRESPLAYIEELMNFKVMGYDKDEGVYVHQMMITDELKNRFKMLHGGITATFLDTAMGSTVFQLMGSDAKALTLELTIHFLSPGISGRLISKTQVIKKGKTIIVMEAKVEDEQKKLVATASSTFFRLQAGGV